MARQSWDSFRQVNEDAHAMIHAAVSNLDQKVDKHDTDTRAAIGETKDAVKKIHGWACRVMLSLVVGLLGVVGYLVDFVLTRAAKLLAWP